MTEKQKYLLKLFKEVDEICKENNLRYVMSGGSLIGAVKSCHISSLFRMLDMEYNG